MLGNTENRKNHRYPSIARAKIPGAFTGDALLKDLSITGCRIECTVHVDVQENSTYTIKVYPEKEARVGAFELVTECKWLRPGGYSCDIGFAVKESPRKKDFEKYGDYLSWRQG
jgi:hypothetical protein